MNQTVEQTKTMNQKQFNQSIESGNSDFSHTVFSEKIVFNSALEQSVDFSYAVFTNGADFTNTSFLEEADFSYAVFTKAAVFSFASFIKRTNFENVRFQEESFFRRSTFRRATFFSSAEFSGTTTFERVFFAADVFFDKCRFLSDLYFRKSYFGARADFTLSFFSNLKLTSFYDIKSSYTRMSGVESEIRPPQLIFRHIFFPARTIFTKTDLSRTDFQNSMIENIVFKDCQFAQTGALEKRNCFYAEIAITREMTVSSEHMDQLLAGQGQWYEFRINDQSRRVLGIGDSILFRDRDNNQRTHKVFITEKHEAENLEKLIGRMRLIDPYYDFESVRKKLSSKMNQERIEKFGVVAFGHRPFVETKFWENLEDLNRQMKKSLEDSSDWQKAGDFYRGEMFAHRKYLKHSKDKPIYRKALAFYDMVAGHGESVGRLTAFMVISLFISTVLLQSFAPELTLSEVAEYNLGFFIPLFSGNANSLESLNLAAWQNVVILIQVIWYYILWFLLALTLQRKFRR